MIIGVKLKENPNLNKTCSDDEYYTQSESYPSVESITNPQKNHVYVISTPEGLTVPRSRLYSIDEYYNRGVMLEKDTEIIEINADTAAINKLSNVTTCIYYQGGWYMFLPQEEIVVGCPAEVIMDYYCQILRKRY